jgi:protein SCO1/2
MQQGRTHRGLGAGQSAVPAAIAVAFLSVGVTLAPVAAPAAPDAMHRTLVDQFGTRFRIADLAGRPVVVTFVASRCTDACPIANAEFAHLADRLKHDRTRATLLTITLDPAYDSPLIMAGEAHRYAADERVWRLASGDPADVRAVMRAFGVVAQPDAHGVPEDHSSFVYVLDAHGKLSRTLLLSTNLPDEAAAALKGHAPR